MELQHANYQRKGNTVAFLPMHAAKMYEQMHSKEKLAQINCHYS
jgi:hypothetical protein